MTFRELLADTVRTLRAHKLRTFLTMFGIAWGIISITLMVAAGEGRRPATDGAAETFGKDIMIVLAGRTRLQAGGLRAGRRVQWMDTDHTAVLAEATACKYVMPELGQGGVRVRSRYNNASLRVTGAHPAFAEIRSIPVAQGHYPNWDDEAAARRVALVGSDAKKQLFGSRNALGETIYVGDSPYVIVGVMREKEQDSSYDGQDVQKIFVPFSRVRLDFPNPPPWDSHSVDRLLVVPKSYEEHEACKWQVGRAPGRLHHLDPHHKEAASIWDTVEDTKAFRQMTDGMKYFMGAVGVTTLFLGGIGVMNIMLVAVKERTREIGGGKAVGASSRVILRQFFVETMLVVLFSGGLGLGGGFGFFAPGHLPGPPPPPPGA